MVARSVFYALFVALVAAAPAFSLTQEDLLEPEKAFQISTRVLGERTVEVRFRIADGYYMYRDRFKFETASGQLLSEVELPPGILKKDPFFGETQTYRREAVLRVPLTPEDSERGHLKLKVTSQGCSDSGVCYVPLEQALDVRLTGARLAGATTATNHISSLLALGWVQALLAAAALATFALVLRFAPASASWRARSQGMRSLYPMVAFAVAALLILGAYPLLAQPLRDLAWGSLLVMLGIWLRAIDPLPDRAAARQRLAKGIGVLALAAGVMMIVSGLGWRPHLGQEPERGETRRHVAPAFERVTTVEAFQARLRDAARPTMLDFYADWCVTCKEMERFTFSDPAVAERMRTFQLLQVDVTRNTASDRAFLKRFGVFGPPAILFFDTAGNELRALRVIGYQPAERFSSTLDRVLRANAEGPAR